MKRSVVVQLFFAVSQYCWSIQLPFRLLLEPDLATQSVAWSISPVTTALQAPPQWIRFAAKPERGIFSTHTTNDLVNTGLHGPYRTTFLHARCYATSSAGSKTGMISARARQIHHAEDGHSRSWRRSTCNSNISYSSLQEIRAHSNRSSEP